MFRLIDYNNATFDFFESYVNVRYNHDKSENHFTVQSVQSINENHISHIRESMNETVIYKKKLFCCFKKYNCPQINDYFTDFNENYSYLYKEYMSRKERIKSFIFIKKLMRINNSGQIVSEIDELNKYPYKINMNKPEQDKENEIRIPE